jgi:hypothetical protein
MTLTPVIPTPVNESEIMKSSKLLLIALGLTAASALFAGTINYDASIDGTTAPGGVTFSATGGSLVAATKNDDVTFLGVDGGPSGTEIDIGQSILLAFDSPATFSSLTFVLLFNGPEYGDHNEIAASLTNGLNLYELRVSDENTGEWFKDGVLQTNVTGIGTYDNGRGEFTISNPFGATGVTSLEIYPLSSNPNGNESDFGLARFSASVPDGGSTAVALGLALLGMAGFARRAGRRA